MAAQLELTSELAVEVTVADQSTIVSVRGDVDVATAPMVRGALTEVEARRKDVGTPRVVLDLSEVTFMDASGLGVLVGAARSARRTGHTLMLRDPSPRVVRLLEMTRLLDVFEVERVLQEAA
jgi:anti-sigma B factor antagonist